MLNDQDNPGLTIPHLVQDIEVKIFFPFDLVSSLLVSLPQKRSILPRERVRSCARCSPNINYEKQCIKYIPACFKQGYFCSKDITFINVFFFTLMKTPVPLVRIRGIPAGNASIHGRLQIAFL